LSADSGARLDTEAILETLDRHRVRYVLIGGMAAVAHGWPGLTLDIDITPSTDRANLGRLAAALREMDAKLRVPDLDHEVEMKLDERAFDLGTTWTFVTRHGYLDVCLRPDGTAGYRDLIRQSVQREVFGLAVSVASLNDIIRSKRAAGRQSDLTALPMLERLASRIEERNRQQPADGENR